MRRRTTVALIGGGTLAAVAGGAFTRARLGGRGAETPLPDEDAQYTVYAPGGKYGFMFNGPTGRVWARIMGAFVAVGYHDLAVEMLDLQPDDELLDIGCGPGVFLAKKAPHVRRVVGLDVSPVMLHEAERQLADRIAAGTARLVLASAAELPFDDGEFSAVTAIFAPANPAEVFRVLRPGGRFVVADPDPRKSPSEPAVGWGRLRRGEADYRRMAEEAGFTDVTFRCRGGRFAGELFVSGRKPADP
jgi:SAM-dependent methyltransferase